MTTGTGTSPAVGAARAGRARWVVGAAAAAVGVVLLAVLFSRAASVLELGTPAQWFGGGSRSSTSYAILRRR